MNIFWARMNFSRMTRRCGAFQHGMTTARVTISMCQALTYFIAPTFSQDLDGCLREHCGTNFP